jgi:Protein of unknown function (DUF4231)
MNDVKSGADQYSFLKDYISEDVNTFERHMKISRWMALWLRLFIAVFSATATILIGLQGNAHFGSYVAQLSALALVASGMSTVLSTWDGLFDYKGDWERYKLTYGQLHGLLIRLEFCHTSPEGCEANELVDIRDKYKELIEKANTPVKP